jgi:hypothetical protein
MSVHEGVVREASVDRCGVKALVYLMDTRRTKSLAAEYYRLMDVLKKHMPAGHVHTRAGAQALW